MIKMVLRVMYEHNFLDVDQLNYYVRWISASTTDILNINAAYQFPTYPHQDRAKDEIIKKLLFYFRSSSEFSSYPTFDANTVK